MNLEKAIKAYQIRKNSEPNTSEFVRRCLTRYGLPGAFQAYHRINQDRADRQSNMLGVKESNKPIVNKILTLIFEAVVTPVEIAATFAGQGQKIQEINHSMGAADWVDNSGVGETPQKVNPKVTLEIVEPENPYKGVKEIVDKHWDGVVKAKEEARKRR